MSGFLGDLSDSQAAALAELTAALKGSLAQPEAARFVERFGGQERCLLRWLRTTGFNVSTAQQRFEGTLKWRIEVKANDILEDEAAIATYHKVKPYWPGAYCGASLDGWPIQFARMGQVNPHQIMKNLTEEDLRIFYIYWLELSNANQVKYMKERELAGKNTNACRGQIEIYDCSNLSIWQMHVYGLGLLAKMLSIGSIHYPENLYRGFIIHIPSVFSLAWRIISPVLNENARRLITLDSGSCEEQLRALIGEAHLKEVYSSVPVDLQATIHMAPDEPIDESLLVSLDLKDEGAEVAVDTAVLKENDRPAAPINVPAHLKPRRPVAVVDPIPC